MKGPLDLFFKMGEKVTRGDPNRQADFVYYMVWILFTAFFVMFSSNLYRAIVYFNIDNAIWAAIGFAICSIQYFSLKGMYDMKIMRAKAKIKQEDVELDSVNDMMKEFNNEKNTTSAKSEQEIQFEKQASDK